MLKMEHSAIVLTFIKLPIVIKIFVLSFFKWPFYTGFTVHGPRLRLVFQTKNDDIWLISPLKHMLWCTLEVSG